MSWRFAVMIVIVPVLMVIALRRPLWGVYATMVMYYFRPGVWGTPGWWQPVYWITVCTFIGWAIRARSLRITPGLVVSGVLVLMMLVSSANAARSPDLSYDVTVVIIKLVAMQFLIVQLVRDMKQLKTFLWMNVIGNLWTLKSVVVITVSGGDASRANVAAAQGGGANYLAMTFAMALPLLFYRYLHGTKIEKRAGLVLAPLMILAIVGTGSRAGFLTVICVFVFLMVRAKKKLLGAGLTLALLVFMVAVTPQAKWERFMTTFQSSEQRGFAAQSRVRLWEAGWRMFTESPVTGKGHDNFQLLSPRYAGFFAGDSPIEYDPLLEGRKGYTGFVCHSTWIQALAEGGLIGAVPFFALFAMSFFTLYRVRRLKLASPDRAEIGVTSQILEGTLWAFIISSTFGSHFKIDFLWWYFGAISVLGVIADQKMAIVRRERLERDLELKAKRWNVDLAGV